MKKSGKDIQSPWRSGKGAHLVRPANGLPDWVLLARHRKPWARLKMFHWPAPMIGPAADNHIPENLDRTITILSRIVGPLLLLMGFAATIWAVAHWFF